MQKQILMFIEKIFEGKESLNIKQFTKIIEEVSSEMLLTVPKITIKKSNQNSYFR
jgi:hypothetical protein